MPTEQLVVSAPRVGSRGDGWSAEPRPAVHWMTTSAPRNWSQASARLRITRAGTTTEAGLSGPDSSPVAWPFEPLRPRERVALSVRVNGVDGSRSEWSEPTEVRAAFLDVGEWVADFIGSADPAHTAQPALFVRTFEAAAGLRRATLYFTARGLVRTELNGQAVTRELFTPGWTSYRHRLLHETVDVTALLRDGSNELRLQLAGGWFTESFGFLDEAHRVYGDQPSVSAQLVLEYDDRSEVVCTDETWLCSDDAALTTSGIYSGETWDTRARSSSWSHAALGSPQVPEARTAPGVHETQVLSPVATLVTPSGATVLDFGQNLVGRLRVTVAGQPGDEVVLRHAEVVENGELCLRPLRKAAATDRFVLDGTGTQILEPLFTFHGFRYAQVDGPTPISVEAVVIGTDLERTGWFDSSHEQLSRLHENVVWSMRGNFLSIPTDCPQRDERLGWTGDIQVFAPTASFLFDCESFLVSWLTDLRHDQVAAGVVPLVVPSVLDWGDKPVAAWGDAAVIVPWTLYRRFGDLDLLAEHFESMRDWVDVAAARRAPSGLWQGDFQFGDWLDPAAPDDRPADGATDVDLVATAYLIRSADLLAESAGLIGQLEAKLRYTALAEEVREAFCHAYLRGDRITSDSQTAYALAIQFELVRDDELVHRFGQRLAQLVSDAGHRIGTGFVGTPLVLDALTSTGHLATAEGLLLQTECPSWLYPVTMGATTVWERWDSMKPDGTVNPGEMTSFNHYALGAVADWMHRVVAGLAPASPGYRRLSLAPHPLPSLDHASAAHLTPYGRAECGWRRESGGTLIVDAMIPPNTSAVVRLPGSPETIELGSGHYSWITRNTIQSEGDQRWEPRQYA